MKLLSDSSRWPRFRGRVTLGILVFQDLFAIALLAVQPNLATLQPLVLLRSLAAGLGLVGAGPAWRPASALPLALRRTSPSRRS